MSDTGGRPARRRRRGADGAARARQGEGTGPREGSRDHGGDRGLRDLVGAGPSRLGVEGALRARDVNRPSEQDLAEAERDVVIVRRHWTPPPPT